MFPGLGRILSAPFTWIPQTHLSVKNVINPHLCVWSVRSHQLWTDGYKWLRQYLMPEFANLTHVYQHPWHNSWRVCVVLNKYTFSYSLVNGYQFTLEDIFIVVPSFVRRPFMCKAPLDWNKWWNELKAITSSYFQDFPVQLFLVCLFLLAFLYDICWFGRVYEP